MPNFEINRGDIFFVDFDPTQGFEIRGNRPALVIQNDEGNRFGNTIIVAPMTRNPKRNARIFVRVSPSESGLPEESTVLLDQIRTLSRDRFTKRRAGRLITRKLQEVDEAIKYSLGLQ